MSLTGRDIIKRGMRLLGALSTGDDPSADELTDALIALNTMIRSLHGTVIGPRLSPKAMTTSMQAENGGNYQVKLAAPAQLTAPLQPRNGARFGAVDVAANFNTQNLTIIPNGQLFAGVPGNTVLNVAGAQNVWFFDADTGNWILEADLASLDVSPPYPSRLISFLPYMFAVEMAAEFGSEIRPDVVAMAGEGQAAFARNYARRGRNQTDAPIGVSIGGQAQQGA